MGLGRGRPVGELRVGRRTSVVAVLRAAPPTKVAGAVMGRARVGVRRAPAPAAPRARVAEGRSLHRHEDAVAEAEGPARLAIAVGEAARPLADAVINTVVAAAKGPETEVAPLPPAVACRGKARHVADEEPAHGRTGRAAFEVTSAARVGRAVAYCFLWTLVLTVMNASSAAVVASPTGAASRKAGRAIRAVGGTPRPARTAETTGQVRAANVPRVEPAAKAAAAVVRPAPGPVPVRAVVAVAGAAVHAPAGPTDAAPR